MQGSQVPATKQVSQLEELVSDIAHEINNPVNVLCSCMTPLQRSVRKMAVLLKLYEQAGEMSPPEMVEQIRRIQRHRKNMEIETAMADLWVVLELLERSVERTRRVSQKLHSFDGESLDGEPVFGE